MLESVPLCKCPVIFIDTNLSLLDLDSVCMCGLSQGVVSLRRGDDRTSLSSGESCFARRPSALILTELC